MQGLSQGNVQSDRQSIPHEVSRGVVRRPIKILHVLGTMSRGGIQVRTVELLRHVDRERYQFHFCALAGQPEALDQEVRSLGGVVHRPHQTVTNASRFFRWFFREQAFDVVHSHLHLRSGYFLRLAAECGIPIRVVHLRCMNEECYLSPWRKLACWWLSHFVDRFAPAGKMRRWVDQYATDILGVSEAVLSSVWGPGWRLDSRCRVVYDGLDPALFESVSHRDEVRREFGLPEDSTLCIHIGRLAQPKNHLQLISIFAELLRHEPSARLLLVGRMSVGRNNRMIEHRVRKRIADLGIHDKIIFSGERNDVPRLLKAADLMIFPSRHEGLGDAVLEACAAGTPSLCSDLPSIREIADRLSGIRRMGLDRSDMVWAKAARTMLTPRPTPETRQVALNAFARSLFTVEECGQSLCRIWEKSRARFEKRSVSRR